MRGIPLWGMVSATLTLGTLLSATLATIALDAFLEGPGPASVTTRVPGFVYASASVMKVCLLAGLVSAVVALARRVWAGGAASPQVHTGSNQGFAAWGIASITLAPLTPLAGAVVVVTAQASRRMPGSLSMADLSHFSRMAVVVMIAMLSAGAMAAVRSLVRGERPQLLPVLGLVTNALLIGLFWHFEFYAIGFDQDSWAPH